MPDDWQRRAPSSLWQMQVTACSILLWDAYSQLLLKRASQKRIPYLSRLAISTGWTRGSQISHQSIMSRYIYRTLIPYHTGQFARVSLPLLLYIYISPLRGIPCRYATIHSLRPYVTWDNPIMGEKFGFLGPRDGLPPAWGVAQFSILEFELCSCIVWRDLWCKHYALIILHVPSYKS